METYGNPSVTFYAAIYLLTVEAERLKFPKNQSLHHRCTVSTTIKKLVKIESPVFFWAQLVKKHFKFLKNYLYWNAALF